MKLAKKSLGQNFLTDKNIIKKIVNTTDIKNRNVIEIGPGTGALTEEILNQDPRSLSLIEKDKYLYTQLKNKYSANNKIKIYNKDILDFNIKYIKKKNCIIFGNLPYNISSQILVKFIRLKNSPRIFDKLIFMFQKELGDKILGKIFSKHYGRLSILTNFKFVSIKMFNINPTCFFPKPKIVSSLLKFEPKKVSNHKIKDLKNLEKITNILFSNKRKMVNKNIKKILGNKKIKKIPDLNLESRPTDLKPEIYYKITELYEEK